MNQPFMLNRLITIEQQYARRFTNMMQKSYGYLFWNEANKDSYMCNHAIITDFIGLESSLKDISFFYKQKDITPRLFPSLKQNELAEMAPHLKNHNFELEVLNHEYYLWERESTIEPVSGLYFDRLVQIKDEVKELIRAENYGEWAVKYLEKHIKSPGYHLLGGFVGDQLVTMGSISVFEGYSRIDDIFTFKFYRGKGYSGSLLDYLVMIFLPCLRTRLSPPRPWNSTARTTASP
ncbi:MAG: GNAT family N-acetyltransferase [Candidatus Cloacimonadaceae bacterium]